MLNMEKRRIVGIISIIVGIAFLFDAQLTGAVISTSIGSSISFIIGMILLVGGIGLIMTGRLEYSIKGSKDYYEKRVEEMFDRKYDHQDVVVPQSELMGILNELKTNPRYGKVNIEHGIENPNIHMTGGPGVPKFLPHLDVKTKKEATRHMIMTSDPNDPRINNVGIVSAGKTSSGLEKGKREKSKTYSPNHPRSLDSGKITIETLSPSQRKSVA